MREAVRNDPARALLLQAVIANGFGCSEGRFKVARLKNAFLLHYMAPDAGEATRAGAPNGVYKGFFFAMQLVRHLRNGLYARTEKKLLGMLSGDETELLRCSMDPTRYEERKTQNPDSLLQPMLAWTGSVLREPARGMSASGKKARHSAPSAS